MNHNNHRLGFPLSMSCAALIFLSSFTTATAQPTEPIEPPPPHIECAITNTAPEPARIHQAALSDGFRPVHAFATGLGVTVAIIDTGIYPHPRLPEVIDGGDFVDAGVGAIIDCDAHGTIVAGVIATRDTGDGIVGIAPDVRLLSLRQTSTKFQREPAPNSPEVAGGSLATLTAAIEAAIDQHAQVINISVVSCLPPGTPPVDTQEFDRVIRKAEAAGVVIVAAAGNLSQSCPQGSTVYPAHHPQVIGVGSLADPYHLAEYSVRSPKPMLAAPGVVPAGLATRDGELSDGIIHPGGIAPFEGTSFATPVVTGTVALLKQRYPAASPQQVRELLFASVDPATGALDIQQVLRHFHTPKPQSATIAIAKPQPADTGSVQRTAWLLYGLGVLTVVALALRQRRM
ncbi:S8 family serine peptidase [Corynebacterium mustelae]|nr:S8 family serine peptidase [Corynebacterium mustelae]